MQNKEEVLSKNLFFVCIMSFVYYLIVKLLHCGRGERGISQGISADELA